MQKMKYILVIDHIATGGAERILIDYYYYLKEKGHYPYIFVLSGYAGQSKWTEDIENITYSSKGDEDNLIKKGIQQINSYFKLKKLILHIKPDVIFSFLEKSNLLTITIPTKARKIVSVHNVLSVQYTKIKSNKIRGITYKMIKWAYNKCPYVIAVSKQVKDDLVHSFGVKECNIHVVNNYVDRKDIHERAKQTVDDFEFRKDKKYIMNVGRFSDQKAQWKLLKAFSVFLSERERTDVELVLMGNGDYKDDLSKLAVKLGIKDKVNILPFKINPYKYMAKADLFVLSSIFEGFPIVLAEVSSLRIPFVGTDKAVPEEMFDDKEFWKQCIFTSSTLEKDFTDKIHTDERKLAELIYKGIEDEAFRNDLLRHTENWERNNNKLEQFKSYEQMIL